MWFLLWLCVWAGAAPAAEVPVVALSPSAHGIALTGKTGYLEDVQGGLSIDEVRSPEWDARFSLPARAVQQSGLSGHARWFKIRVRQDEPFGRWLIDSNLTAAREFTVYGPYDAQGRALGPPFEAGTSVPPDKLSLDSNRFSYRFQLDRPGEYTIYLRFVSDFTDYFSFTVWDAVRFGQWEQGQVLFHGICYGVMVGVLLVNLVLLIGLRERLYGYNTLSCLFALVTIGSINGHVGRYLLADAGFLIPYTLALGPPMWIFFGVLFGSHFLELPRYAPRLSKCVKVGLVVCLVAILLALMGRFAWSIALMQTVAATVPWLLFAGAVIVLRQGFKPAGWYLAGLFLLDIAGAGTALKNYGWLDWSNPYMALQIGIVVEGTVFVVAMGSRIQRLHQLNGELGRQATQLSTAAHTDVLTGVFNRAGWMLHGARALAQGRHAAVLLIDLDHFKPVNDRYGHETGDKVLSTVSRRMQSGLHSPGVVARLGGDEFAVLLLNAADPSALQQQAQHLIELISQPVHHKGNGVAVGASIGIACHPLDGASLSTLMHAADRAMYSAKQRGGGCFAFSADVRQSFLPQQHSEADKLHG